MKASYSLLFASLLPLQHVVVGETSQGAVYWHGHFIPPPYRLTVGYTVSADTCWSGPYVNGYTMGTLRERVRPLSSATADRHGPVYPDRAAALKQAIHRTRERIQAGEAGGYVRMLAQELSSHEEVVDSVALELPARLLVHWKGATRAEVMKIGSGTPREDWPDPFQLHWNEARGHLGLLAGNWVLLVSGGNMSIPPGRFTRAHYDSARAGLDLRSIPAAPHVLAQIARPEPIDSLILRQVVSCP
jgi:hypothetical protein